MDKLVKIILFPTEHKSKNGTFFEELMRSVFKTQGYEIEKNINFTGLEIDLSAKHLDRNENLYIECKAKQKPRSEEIKNFVFNISHKKADYGYFVYTEELDHQAGGLKSEIEGDPTKYKNITFFGPDKIITSLINANKIKDYKSLDVFTEYDICKLILSYTYFGIYYIAIITEGTLTSKFLVIDASTLNFLSSEDINQPTYGNSGITKIFELQKNIEDLQELDFDNFEGSVQKNQNIENSKQYIPNCDVPPNITKWVGRNKELLNIASENFKVIFITGFGGEGKSTLASYYIKKEINSKYEYWDWRDCKEESDRIHTKIISTIERLTNGVTTAKLLSELNNAELIDTFFHYLGSRSVVFVFDNVDHYIDLEDFLPKGGIGRLFFEALKREHNSKFIFTCRPFVRHASADFYQIKLEGLTLSETEKLFESYNIPIKKDELKDLVIRSHQFTQGHPLWLNLIAAQALRGREKATDLLDKISYSDLVNEDNITSILSEKILGVVWDSLNSKQKTLLRAMSETVKAESEDDLSKIIESEINYNQFLKSLKSLINLNLIVLKSFLNNKDLLDLHPLVKEFIRYKFPRSERSKFITLLEKHYDKFIFILKPRLTENLPLSSYENWTHKIELEINKADFKTALVVLEEIDESIIKAGYAEEYIRVTKILFNKIDWQLAVDEEYSYFLSQLSNFVETLTHFGEKDYAESLLSKYAGCISGKGNNYIRLCSLRCYCHWYNNEIIEAIKWGEKGEYLSKPSNIEDDHSLIHNLSLARRDSHDKKYLNMALNYFLKGEDLDEILKPEYEKELSGSFFGNVGRCLQYLSRHDDALICYKKSLLLLFQENIMTTVINIGYACKWISEILINKSLLIESLYFIKLGVINWSKVAPSYGERLNDSIKSINLDEKSKTDFFKLEDWQIEKYCKEFISNSLHKK